MVQQWRRTGSYAGDHATPSLEYLRRAIRIGGDDLQIGACRLVAHAVPLFPIAQLYPSPELRIEVALVWIETFDDFDLPLSIPALEGLLALDRRSYVIVLLMANHTIASIFARKTGCDALAMLPNAPFNIGRDADIQRAAFLIGDDVNTSCHACRMLGDGSSGKARAFTETDKRDWAASDLGL